MADAHPPGLQFPCRYAVKGFGHDSDAFIDTMLAHVRNHAPEVNADQVTTRRSRQGSYLSVTVTFQAQSRAQLDAIYRDLTADDAVLMAL